jgi:hypothetical protein
MITMQQYGVPFPSKSQPQNPKHSEKAYMTQKEPRRDIYGDAFLMKGTNSFRTDRDEKDNNNNDFSYSQT